MNEPEIKVKSLQKALEVLNCFSEERRTLGVTEISEKLGLYKSNVHNILMTFKAMHYLEQDPETGKFYLGSAVLGLARAFSDSYDISRLVLPYMQKISQEVKELVYLAVPSRDEVIYLEAVYPEKSFFVAPSIRGEHCKMYCTSVGKAILSRMSEEEMEKRIPDELVAFTDNTITDREALKREIQKVREQGYAFDNMEVTYGIKCVGVPIVNKEGIPQAALSISTPSLRMEGDKINTFVKVLKKYVAEIERRL